MDNVAARIYVILSAATLILFILTRRVHIRVIKKENTIFSVGFLLFKIEFTKSKKAHTEKAAPAESAEGETPVDFGEIFSLIKSLLHYFGKCTVTVRCLSVPFSESSPGIYKFFGFRAMISMALAYIESNVEKLIIVDNAFILSSDGNTQFDVDIGIMLFDLIILILRLITKVLKIGRLEKANVGN